MILEVLYANVCNLYGDLHNVTLLKETLKDEIEVIYTEFYQKPYFVDHKVDMIYIGSLMEKYQRVVIENLLPYKEKLNECIENNTIILATGNAIEIFGKRIDDLDGLNLFDFYSTHDFGHHHNSCYLGQFEDQYITGFQSHFSHRYHCEQPLFKTLKGFGFDDCQEKEGIKKNNFFGTYLIGPILIMNPGFTHYLLKLLNCDRPLANEQAMKQAFDYRVKEYLSYSEFKEFKH